MQKYHTQKTKLIKLLNSIVILSYGAINMHCESEAPRANNKKIYIGMNSVCIKQAEGARRSMSLN